MNEPGYVGIWRRVLPLGEFKFAISVLHVHPGGRGAKILYSFRPFHDLDSPGPSFGHWQAVDDSRAVMRLEGDEDEFQLRYIPDRQLEVRYLAGREVYERATVSEISVNHLNLIGGIDFNGPILVYLEHGIVNLRSRA